MVGGGQHEKKLPPHQRMFKSDRDKIEFCTIGAVAGLAAAFRAPFSGVAFAFEVPSPSLPLRSLLFRRLRLCGPFSLLSLHF